LVIIIYYLFSEVVFSIATSGCIQTTEGKRFCIVKWVSIYICSIHLCCCYSDRIYLYGFCIC